ncbi:P-loop containing nucleoside triphosphate hydrolase protein [Pyrenochaeta sp. MPI-SDFR-AT-0127]|nr:P-loop containing nucleoside triphosphate hydrolase protein [Pyrenochaeta sp. MPI-SDFR-AT-0127]
MSNLKLDGVKLPCYSVPVARNKDFYGRQNILDEIDQFFSAPGISHREDGDPSRSFALCGPGGMGKTQIATEYVHRCKASNAFDAIFWVYADKPSKISDGISQIAVSLGLVPAESKEALDPVITTNLAKEWLSNPARFSNFADEKRKRQPTWLLILDNANDIRVLERFWPIGGPGCLLVTSRDPLAKDPSVLADSGHDIESFSPQESGEMLERLTRRKGNGPAIGDRLGGLPLALAQMAGVIIRNHMSFQDFLDTWDENKEHSELLGYDHKLGQSDGYDKNLSTAWAVESLRHGKLLLEVISFFDPDSIQEVILKQFSTVELVQYPNTHGAYLKARRELLQTSLLAKDRTEKNVSVHRMVQDVTRSKMGKEQYQNIFAAALHLLAQKWPYAAFGWRHTVARWRMCEELFPHVLSLNGYGSRLMQACDNTSIKIEYCKLMNDAGWYYHETGRFVESQALIEHAQSVAEAAQSAVSHVRKESGTEKDTAQQLITLLAETHHNLGCIGTESNQPKFALFHFRKFNEMTIAEIDRQRLKTDKRLAISWNELGNAFMMNKMWFDGERCYKKCLQVAQQMPNFAPAQFSFPYVNLGLAYWITERLSEAKQTLEEGLRHRVAAYGQDDHESFITGRFLYALGNVAASNGDLGESLSYHERALRQFLSTIGKNHHHTGDIHIKVGEHHLRSGNLNEAAIHFDEALRIFNEHAIFRPELTRATFWKSRLLKASGRVEEARKVKDKSVEMYFDVTLGAVQDIIEPSLADFDGIVAFWSQ